MKHFTTALALVCAGPAVAQDRMSQSQCDGSAQALLAMTNTSMAPPDVTLTDTGWCRIEDVILPFDSRIRLQLAEFEWRGSDMGRFIDEGLPPRALEVRGAGVGVLTESGFAVIDYLLEVQMRAQDIAYGFDARWDGLQDTVVIEDAHVHFDETNRFTAALEIAGVDLTDMATIQTSMGSAGLRDLTLTAQFDGWFEQYLASVLIPMLLEESEVSPAAQVAALKRQAIDAIALLPEETMPLAAQEALGAFVNTLPYPRGTARLQLSADPTLSMARVVPLGLVGPDASVPEVLEAALDGVTLLFTWSPERAQ